jgi:hypothetical protein
VAQAGGGGGGAADRARAAGGCSRRPELARRGAATGAHASSRRSELARQRVLMTTGARPPGRGGRCSRRQRRPRAPATASRSWRAGVLAVALQLDMTGRARHGAVGARRIECDVGCAGRSRALGSAMAAGDAQGSDSDSLDLDLVAAWRCRWCSSRRPRSRGRRRCDNPPRKIPYYHLRPIHFGH